MVQDRLAEISFVFPDSDDASRTFFSAFQQLFVALPQAEVTPDAVSLRPLNPVGALPRTCFRLAAVRLPQLVCSPAPLLDAVVGGVALGGRADAPVAGTAALGLPIQQVVERLRGHVTRVDHTGVNLPTTMFSSADWQAMLAQFAAHAAVYRYPDADWPFVLPSTADEFADDITTFVLGREPKFELVYDQWASEPIWQFALGTDLTRAELEERFPPPEGWAIPELAELFRSVTVAHPWPQLSFRLDLYYRSDGSVSDWDTGEWLVTEGGRIR